MVKKIHLKLLRDTKASWMQFGAVALIITLGVAIFITSYAAYKNLDSSYEYTFQQLNMADYWISVDNLPPKAVKEIDEIPGVAAQGRIVGDVVLDLAPIYRGERVLGRVVSLPRYGNTAINNVQVTSGSYFSSDSGREILMEKRFAEYHKMNPGDWLTIERENSKLRFRISGIATSPEYIWVARSAQDMMPSPRTFGILFMSQPGAESLFGMTGGTNEIIMTVAAGVDRKAVLDEVRNILRKNGIKRLTSKDEPVTVETRRADIFQGVRTAYMVERKDQLSNRLLKMDLDGFREMAVLFPTLFLSVAALAIYTLLSRLVESQRVQIGLMRALGYSRRSVLMHFLGFALLVGILGSVSGAILGSLMANALTVEYAKQLKIPFIIISPPWSVVLTGIITGIMVPVAAGIIPAWATAGMRPAQAMRPAPPSTGHGTLPEIVLPFLRKLPYLVKVPLRNIFRNLRRSFFMSLGLASAVAMVLVSMSFLDAMDSLMTTQFEKIINFDARIIFQGMGSKANASYIRHLDGIKQAEAALEAPYRLRHGNRVSDSSILGLEKKSDLYRLYSPEGKPTTLDKEDIFVTLSLKKKLGVEVGDTIYLEPMVGTVEETKKRLAGFIDEPMGNRAFTSLEEVQKLLNAPGAASEILVQYDGPPSPALMKRLYDIPQTASIENTAELRGFIDELNSFFWVFLGVMLTMSGTLGMAVIFNGVMVNILERKREITVMRAIGMSRRRITAMLTLENLVIGCLGIIIGIPLGNSIAAYFMSTYETDFFSMKMVIFTRTYVIATVAAMVILLASQIPAIRQIYKLSLSSATKDWAE